MTTTAVNSTPAAQGNQLPSSITSSPDSKYALKTSDFINMMVTQLQNQDPLQPTSNQDLLAQMSQISQLQSSTDLTSSLKSMVLQNNLGAAGNLIGKKVEGTDDQNEKISGLVNSIRVEDGNVFLELDSGQSLQLGNVTSISSAPAASTPTSTTTTPAPASTGG